MKPMNQPHYSIYWMKQYESFPIVGSFDIIHCMRACSSVDRASDFERVRSSNLSKRVTIRIANSTSNSGVSCDITPYANLTHSLRFFYWWRSLLISYFFSVSNNDNKKRSVGFNQAWHIITLILNDQAFKSSIN